jgi:hypothetical protein
MMFNTRWANDQQTAVFVEFSGTWEADDFTHAEHELITMLSEVGHGVAVVVNITQPRPISMSVLGEVHSFLTVKHPNRGKMVMVAPDGFLPGLQQVIMRMFGGDTPVHIHFTNTLDHANAVLQA